MPDDDDRFELGASAFWLPGLGVSFCCGDMLERLELRGELLISRCSGCGRPFFLDESAEAEDGAA